MSFLITAAVVGGASTVYGIGKGISQSAQANKIDKNNPRPVYDIPDEYKQNQSLAKQMAQVGLPQQQYNNQLNAIGRNQAAGIQTLGRSANPGSGVASVVRASNDASNNLNAQDAAARQQNQRFFIGQNGVLGQQKLAQQQYNKFDKYTEQFNKSAALRGAANQNIQNGVNGAVGMATNLYGLNQGSSAEQPFTTFGQANNNPYINQSAAAYPAFAPSNPGVFGYQQPRLMSQPQEFNPFTNYRKI